MFFNNKVIWITGASSGIGAELAMQLAPKQAKLILTARNIDLLKKISDKCSTYGQECTVLPADLYDNQKLIALTDKAIEVYGHIDIIIHCAGVSQRSLAYDTDNDVYRKLMEINFFAPVTITKALLPHYKKRKSGHIVVLSSMAGLMGFPKRTGYAAAKHALKGFFETFQTENNLPNVYTTIISPGRIQTPISISALTADGNQHNEMDEGQLNGIPVSDCAKTILRGIEKKKRHVIIARGERLLWWFWWFWPQLYFKIARRKGL